MCELWEHVTRPSQQDSPPRTEHAQWAQLTLTTRARIGAELLSLRPHFFRHLVSRHGADAKVQLAGAESCAAGPGLRCSSVLTCVALHTTATTWNAIDATCGSLWLSAALRCDAVRAGDVCTCSLCVHLCPNRAALCCGQKVAMCLERQVLWCDNHGRLFPVAATPGKVSAGVGQLVAVCHPCCVDRGRRCCAGAVVDRGMCSVFGGDHRSH